MGVVPVAAGGRASRSVVTPLASFDGGAATGGSLSVCRVVIETGRTHQIRVHMAAVLGCPLVGDSAYGGGGARGDGRRDRGARRRRRRASAAALVAGAAAVAGGARLGGEEEAAAAAAAAAAVAAAAAAAAAARRPMLHAAELVLPHPTTGVALAIQCPPPPDFAALAGAVLRASDDGGHTGGNGPQGARASESPSEHSAADRLSAEWLS